MNLGIVGSRGFSDYKLLSERCHRLIEAYGAFNNIVSGGAKGADSLGVKFAEENKIETLIFLPDWEYYGKSAGMRRNVEIIENSDVVIAFWDGKSKGTLNSIELSKKLKKDLIIVKYNEITEEW